MKLPNKTLPKKKNLYDLVYLCLHLPSRRQAPIQQRLVYLGAENSTPSTHLEFPTAGALAISKTVARTPRLSLTLSLSLSNTKFPRQDTHTHTHTQRTVRRKRRGAIRLIYDFRETTLRKPPPPPLSRQHRATRAREREVDVPCPISRRRRRCRRRTLL